MGVRQGRKNMAGIILAAGESRRMGEMNKLLEDINGVSMIRKVTETMLASHLDSVFLVLGHDAELVARAVLDLPVTLMFNPDYQQGQSQSIRYAIERLNKDMTDVLIALGDMPQVSTKLINQLMDHHLQRQNSNNHITVPEYKGKRGNPVIWGKAFFKDLKTLSGDMGGRALFHAYAAAMNPCIVDDDAVLKDIDTVEMLDMIRKMP